MAPSAASDPTASWRMVSPERFQSPAPSPAPSDSGESYRTSRSLKSSKGSAGGAAKSSRAAMLKRAN
eukprot:9340527-Lingulodinium_polyedra.AAC.1